MAESVTPQSPDVVEAWGATTAPVLEDGRSSSWSMLRAGEALVAALNVDREALTEVRRLLLAEYPPTKVGTEALAVILALEWTRD